MNQDYYYTIINQLKSRSVVATLGVLGLKSKALREYLEEQLTNDHQNASNLLADPVFEAVFPWKMAAPTLDELSGMFLHPSLVNAMDAPPNALQEFAFKRTFKPYTHQLQSWKLLSEPTPRSIVVTSGTGSGKTECFMVPILNDLAKQVAQTQYALEGVQALFIYPLNALINSQRDRFNAWTHGFDSKIRFCLYNGNTPTSVRAHDKNNSPNQVLSRTDLWTSPPPILITNPTMLEYMLIRNNDKPIIEKSKGKLKYIVLDEAHTYIGSQAAELSLLIRRVLHTFEVKPENVRFIATSATIGSDEAAKTTLREYLASLAGINAKQIEVIDGKRDIPRLPENHQPFEGTPEDILELSTIDEQRTALYASPQARKIRTSLVKQQTATVVPKTLTELTKSVFGTDTVSDENKSQVLRWLDVCTEPQLAEADSSFLPLRAHLFHRVLHGLWACVNPECKQKIDTALVGTDWQYGKVYTYQREKCECGAPIYEIVTCHECNTEHLQAYRKGEKLIQAPREEVDEFSLDVEVEADAGDEDPFFNHPAHTAILAPKEHEDYHLRRVNNEGVMDGWNGDGILVHLNESHGVDDKLVCSHCSYAGRGRSATFRHAYLGTPFYISNIVPTLLEHCPDGKDQPLSRPMRGRSLITFTDSRQGTARIAAKIQQDAERSRTRGIVYQAISKATNGEKVASLQSQIEAIKPLVQSNPALKDTENNLEQELQALQNSVISWEDLLSFMQNDDDIKVHMLDYYKEVDPDLFNSEYTLSRILLAREFGRRPKRANSLETLGLVAITYQGLNNIYKTPDKWESYGLALSDWHDFLKITLDFFVRDGVYVNIPKLWWNWLGGKYTPKYLLSPENDKLRDYNHKAWPRYDGKRKKRQHRIIRLLAHALNIDLEIPSKEDVDIIDNIMACAWKDLANQARILTSSTQPGSFQLELDKLQFRSVSSAWLCPVTQKVLDTTFREYTPYLPVGADPNGYRCESIEFPKKPDLVPNSREEAIRAIRNWIDTDSAIKELRMAGVWTNQSDSIAEGGAFFRTAEHSAQQPARKLDKYERKFREGRLNVLSCSTTMEMGVDIGGLSMVCNNNVPPHPANYLQRAGRAGRRKETRSLSLTICKDNPHDQVVFRKPLWAFTTRLKQPNITLSSERIVQRHVNALLLGYMLKERMPHRQTEAIRLECGWFFKRESDRPSICDKMLAWLKEFGSSGTDQKLEQGIKSIVKGSSLAGDTIAQIIARAEKTLTEISHRWLEEYDGLQQEWLPLQKKSDRDPYKKRVQRDMDRHEKEYLLSELVAGGFLPGYGFPTGIAPFNPFTLSDYKKSMRSDNDEREDNRQRYKEKPSRDLAMALREYAPGAEVVLDGLVYKSEGLSLNWHIPDDDTGIVENQKLGKAWRCKNCGCSGTANTAFNGHCVECGNPIDKDHQFEFIQPSGFATGFYSIPSNDITTQSYIPDQEPWINANSPLKPLPDASLGYFKANAEGHIFHYSAGEHKQGYALCLGCGRAESMKVDGSDPKMVDQHDRLRGKINGSNGRTCDAGTNKIVRHIRLGYADKTDVFELYLKKTDTNEFIRAEGAHQEGNLTLCWTMGVALRYGLATSLGINTEELGLAVRQARIDQENRPVFSICLYDTSGGGAGFASAAPQYLNDMFRRAQDFLGCSHCEAACEHCLLQYDTRKVSAYLDRKVGLAYLNEDFLNRIRLPEEEKLLGDQSEFCTETFLIEVDRYARELNDEIKLFLNGPADEWNIAESRLKRQLIRYGDVFKKINLCLSEEVLNQLTQSQRQDLYGLLQTAPNVELFSTANLPFPDGGVILAQLSGGDATLSFATRQKEITLLNERWGDSEGALIVKAEGYRIDLSTQSIDSNELLLAVKSSDKEISILDALNGNILGFGQRFWDHIEEHTPDIRTGLTAEAIQHVYYSDAYLASPLSVILLSTVLAEMRQRYQVDENSTSLRVDSLRSEVPHRQHYRNRSLFHNWYQKENITRQQLMQALFSVGFESCSINLHSSKKDISHARHLMLRLSSGNEINLRLDQGLGYWQLNGAVTYPFDKTVEQQCAWIDRKVATLSVSNGKDYPTYVFKSEGLTTNQQTQ